MTLKRLHDPGAAIEKMQRPNRVDQCALEEPMAASGLRQIRCISAIVLTLALCFVSGMRLPAIAGADGPDRFRVIDVRAGNTLTILVNSKPKFP